MGNWYRLPKKLNLKGLIRGSHFTFVLDSAQFSESDLVDIRTCLSIPGLSQRLCLGTAFYSNTMSILIAPADNKHKANLSQLLTNGWYGIIAVPNEATERQDVLVDFFTRRSYFKLGDHNRREFSKDHLPQFLLDLTVAPGVIFTNQSFDGDGGAKTKYARKDNVEPGSIFNND